MTDKGLRAALARRRKSAGWTFEELAADVHAKFGAPVISEATLANFIRGADVSPRISGLMRAYLDKAAA